MATTSVTDYTKGDGVKSILATITATVLLNLPIYLNPGVMPSMFHEVNAEPRAYSWIQQSINPYPYYETDVTREMISELDIINNFVSKVVSESQELNPDMARLINKNFWELV